MKKTTDLSKSFDKLKEDINWHDIVSLLESNHLFPRYVSEKRKIIGLEISCNAGMEEMRSDKIREILGEGFNINFQAATFILFISKK